MTQTWKYGALSLFLSAILVSGCSSASDETGTAASGTNASKPQDATQTEQTVDQETEPAQTEGAASKQEPPASQGDEAAHEQEQTSMEVERILFDGSIGEGYHKKVELMKDGSEHIVITNPQGKVQVDKREYEGLITSVNGQVLTVQLKQGLEKQITIHANVKRSDDTGKDYQVGLEIEWEQDAEGNILEVELDD